MKKLMRIYFSEIAHFGNLLKLSFLIELGKKLIKKKEDLYLIFLRRRPLRVVD